MQQTMGAALLAIAICLGATAPAQPASAQPVPAAETRAHFGGHTTTFAFENRTYGTIHLTLALLGNGTGWLFSEPGPGGTFTRRQRQIYRWWVSEDGRLCYHYSPAPDRMFDRSMWTCWAVGRGEDGRPALTNPRGEPFVVLRRVPGNALSGMNHFFREAVQRAYPGGAPTPPPPLNPPPP